VRQNPRRKADRNTRIVQLRRVERWTFQRIADEFRLTNERIRQIVMAEEQRAKRLGNN
jgi:DNA-directed RNA polymerase sigma subunit (sigma70/sigma32)